LTNDLFFCFSSSYWSKTRHNEQELEQIQDLSLESNVIDEVTMKMSASYNEDASPTRMFGDTIQYRNSKQFRRLSRGQIPPKPGPPPTLPAPVPTPVVPESYSKQQQQQQQQQQALTQSHSFSSSGGPPLIEKRKSGTSTLNYNKPVSVV
jgi:BAI1-associated protein 2